MSLAKLALPTLSISLTTVLLAACMTPTQNSALQQAHTAYDTASKDPAINAAASPDLQKAAGYLKSADEAQATDAGQAEVSHRAYMATQQVHIAYETANLQRLQAEFRSTPRALAGSGNLFFQTGEATITPGTQATIDRLVVFLQQNPEQRVRIEGYADDTGNRKSNMKLSQRRADAVKQALVSHGIEASRIETLGGGEASPVASNGTAEGRQMNRRATVVVSNFSVNPNGSTTGSSTPPSTGDNAR
jgi:outer membrane protein OmpA-like peptidoglycan-associated protein